MKKPLGQWNIICIQVTWDGIMDGICDSKRNTSQHLPVGVPIKTLRNGNNWTAFLETIWHPNWKVLVSSIYTAPQTQLLTSLLLVVHAVAMCFPKTSVVPKHLVPKRSCDQHLKPAKCKELRSGKLTFWTNKLRLPEMMFLFNWVIC